MFVPIIHGTGFPIAHRAHPFSLHADAVDLIDLNGQGYGAPIEFITISELGANGNSAMNFRYEDPRNLHALPARARIQLKQWITPGVEEPQFTGFITNRAMFPDDAERGYVVDVTCTDLGHLFDTTTVPAYHPRAGFSDKQLVQSLVALGMRSNDINTHSGFVTQTNASMESIDFSHMTLRAALEAVQSLAGADRHFYVDFFGRLHWFSGVEAGTPAPFTITQTTPSPGGQRAAKNIRLEYDDSQIVTAVYIIGGTPAGTGWVKDETAIKRYGLLQASYDAPHSKTAVGKANVGAHFLALHKDPIVRGSFEQHGTDTGWRVGQSVVITNAQLGISAASYPIKQIDTTAFDGGNGHRHRTIYFGDLPAAGRRNPLAPSGASAGGGPSLGLASGWVGTRMGAGAPRVLGPVTGSGGLADDVEIL